MKKNKNNVFHKGFTLIEILLVIVLMGILLSIVLVSLNTTARFIDSRNEIRQTNIQTLESAITQYRLQVGSYPTGLSRTYQEICDPDTSSCSGYIDLKQFLVPTYLQAIPQDPSDSDSTGGAGYSIAVDIASNTVSIRALQAEDGVEIKINDPLPNQENSATNTPLATTIPIAPASGQIVTNGLILNLDAGNLSSYPGTGTTWTDLSGSNNTGTLVNGVGYNSANGGSLVFDGIDDYVLANNTSLSSQFVNTSVSHFIWVYPTGAGILVDELGLPSPMNPSWRDSNIEINSSGVFSFSTWHGSLGNKVVSSNRAFNTWYYVGFTYNGTTLTAYINGVSIGTTNFVRQAPYNYGYQLYYALFSNDTTNMGTGSNGVGRCGAFSVYNRELSSTEVSQNFNATRGRFGL